MVTEGSECGLTQDKNVKVSGLSIAVVYASTEDKIGMLKIMLLSRGNECRVLHIVRT